ncbi:Arm DNA-binding domain-containing protein [Sphingobacterium lumbrici]
MFRSSHRFNFIIKNCEYGNDKKSTFKVLFYLKKNAQKKNGKVTVMCRITINGKQSAFSTKLDISASNWDLKYGRVLGKSREAQDTNSKLDKIRSGIEGMLFQNSEERGGCKQC